MKKVFDHIEVSETKDKDKDDNNLTTYHSRVKGIKLSGFGLTKEAAISDYKVSYNYYKEHSGLSKCLGLDLTNGGEYE